MGDFFMILLVSITVAVSSSAFNRASFYPESVEYAQEVCASNGGWERLVESGSGQSRAECRNGANFTYDWAEIRSKKP